ncbi:MAG: hypothetical protein SGCHY_003575, partial [Lobulomycetales sp.]
GKNLRIAWGKSKGKAQFRSGARKSKQGPGEEEEQDASAAAEKTAPVSDLDRVLEAGIAPPPGSGARVYYPSMNPL